MHPCESAPDGRILTRGRRIIIPMKLLRGAALLVLLLLSACQPQAPARIAIVDGMQLHVLITNERVPRAILAQAGILLTPADLVLSNGYVIPLDDILPVSSTQTLQMRRAAILTVNGVGIRTTARTLGEALSGPKTPLYASDGFEPAASSVITGPITVRLASSRELVVRVDGRDVHTRSAAATVGKALADAGLPLLGMDFSRPAESEPLPADGQIQIVRVSESVVLSQKSLPFEADFKESANVELGQEQILQPGLNGLAVSRVRIRYEDGKEVSRQTESETVVRPPQNRIAARGTKIVLKTTTVNGVTIQYWRMLQMYATVYSPCNSGGSEMFIRHRQRAPSGKRRRSR